MPASQDTRMGMDRVLYRAEHQTSVINLGSDRELLHRVRNNEKVLLCGSPHERNRERPGSGARRCRALRNNDDWSKERFSPLSKDRFTRGTGRQNYWHCAVFNKYSRRYVYRGALGSPRASNIPKVSTNIVFIEALWNWLQLKCIWSVGFNRIWRFFSFEKLPKTV